MKNPFKQIPVSRLQCQVDKLKRPIQAGNLRVVCTRLGSVAGFLLPYQDIDRFSLNVQTSEEMPLRRFRDRLTPQHWHGLGELDCIYLTFRGRRSLVFVSHRFTSQIPMPLIGDPGTPFHLLA